MDELKKTKGKLAELRAKLAAIHELGVAEKRALTPEEQAQWDQLAADVDALKTQVSTLEQAAGIEDQTDPNAAQDGATPTDPAMASADGRSQVLAEIAATLERPNQRQVVRSQVTGGGTRRIIVPAEARRHANRLKGFRGEGALENAYASGQWLMSTLYGSQRATQWCRDHGIQTRALSTNVNTAGGYLVPTVLENAIIDLREEYGVFRQNVDVWPMSSDTMLVPRRTGGLTVYLVGDNAEITASDKSWDQVTLTARKWGVLTKYSSEIDEDAVIQLASDLSSEIAYAFALKEDQCGFLGDGTSTYGGIHGVTVKINDGNHAAGLFTAASGHTAFSTLTLADFNGISGQLPEYARPNAKWFISRVGYANSMERLAYAAGGNTVREIAGEEVLTFMGYPVVISQVLNTTTAADVSAIKLLFGDLSMSSIMGDRRGVTISTTDQRYWELDQLAIKGTTRFDINNHSLGDGTNAGPILALKTPAS